MEERPEIDGDYVAGSICVQVLFYCYWYIIPFSVIFSPFHPGRYFGGWEQLNFSVVENVVKSKLFGRLCIVMCMYVLALDRRNMYSMFSSFGHLSVHVLKQLVF